MLETLWSRKGNKKTIRLTAFEVDDPFENFIIFCLNSLGCKNDFVNGFLLVFIYMKKSEMVAKQVTF